MFSASGLCFIPRSVTCHPVTFHSAQDAHFTTKVLLVPMSSISSVFRTSRHLSRSVLAPGTRFWSLPGSEPQHQWTARKHGGRRPMVTFHLEPELVPVQIPIDEERLPKYDQRYYYPANPGDVFDGRYRLVSKVGWGSDSTVWLAEVTTNNDFEAPREFAALKICNCDILDSERWSEAHMHMHLAEANPGYPGYAVLGISFEAFDIRSPRGDDHLVLAFEPLREPLWLFRRRISTKQSAPMVRKLRLIKIYVKILLEGLDYMHSQCKVVHTDLKLDNILLTFESESTIESYADRQNANPMARKVFQDHVVYRCHNDFGPILISSIRGMIPKITDFGLAQRCEVPVLWHPIQTDIYRAPEVILGIGWKFSADMWNFGLMIWEFVTGDALFTGRVENAQYSPARHLAEMIAVLGDVPAEIIRREKDLRRHPWGFEIMNAAGKICGNATDFYGGPFFDEEGVFKYKDLIPQTQQTLEEKAADGLRKWISEKDDLEEEVKLFLTFMRRMLRWVPQERATAGELIDDPWVGHIGWRKK